jgi:4'-phosphopantetheinyl transferase
MQLPSHAPDDVRVWLIEIDFNAPLDYAVLNEAEIARAGRYLRSVDAARFAAVRAALRHVLAAQLNKDPASLVIEPDANGRPAPALKNAPDFNVSHSGAYGAIALSSQRSVGIDIEEARAKLDWRGLTSVVFADADTRAIEALHESAQRNAFFDCWTAKEAVLKAHGTGMGAGAIRMDAFSVLPREGERYALSKEAGAYEVAVLKAPANYAAALSWSQTASDFAKSR